MRSCVRREEIMGGTSHRLVRCGSVNALREVVSPVGRSWRGSRGEVTRRESYRDSFGGEFTSSSDVT
jgi:P2-related tail formation protein